MFWKRSGPFKREKFNAIMIKKLKWTFDWKKFFIQRGERVGFSIAVVVMMLMVVINCLSMGLANTTAAANTRLLKALNTQASQKVTTSTPPPEMAALPHELQGAGAPVIDPDLFVCQRPFFGREAQPDRKWREPRVLAPVEFTAQVVRGGIESYMLVMGDDHKPKLIGVLAPHDASQDLKAAMRMQGVFAKYDAFNAVAAQALGGAGGGPGTGQGGPGGPGGSQGSGHRHHPKGATGHGAQQHHHGHGGGGESGAGESDAGQSGADGGGAMASSAGSASSAAGDTERPGPVRAQAGSVGQGQAGPAAPALRADLLNRTVLPREADLKFISVSEFMEKPSGKRLAKTVIPTRMAIVSGSFPYRSQLEEYRCALHFDSVEALLNDPDATPEFLGMQVQRRLVKPNGDPISDWADLDIETPIRQLKLASTGSQKERAELLKYGIIVYPNRLVMPRPKLSRHEHYPADHLNLVKKAIAEYKKSAEVIVVPASPKPSIFDQEIDVWSDAPILGGEGGNARAAIQPAPAAGSGSRATGNGRRGRGRLSESEALEGEESATLPERLHPLARVPPRYCLVRFIDVTIEPGCTYEYRVKIEIANPSYNKPDRAVTESLTLEPAIMASQWTVVSRDVNQDKSPLLVTVPDDLEYFAVDERTARAYSEHERMPMEVHRWLDFVQVDPVDRASIMPVGGWSILPPIPVRRGEYIGQTVELPVPVWKPTLNGFAFATPPEDEERRGSIKRTIHHPGVPVDFATDPLSEIAGGAILIDFDGGNRTDPKDHNTVLANTPWEVLVYTADNKLVLRNSARDTSNPNRLARVNDWEQWLKATANRGQTVNSGGNMFGAGRRGNKEDRGKP
jgi:hypothetical protein